MIEMRFRHLKKEEPSGILIEDSNIGFSWTLEYRESKKGKWKTVKMVDEDGTVLCHREGDA